MRCSELPRHAQLACQDSRLKTTRSRACTVLRISEARSTRLPRFTLQDSVPDPTFLIVDAHIPVEVMMSDEEVRDVLASSLYSVHEQCGSACVHTSVGVLVCIHLWECLCAYICGSACVHTSVGVLACIHLHILTHMIVTCYFVFQSHRCSFSCVSIPVCACCPGESSPHETHTSSQPIVSPRILPAAYTLYCVYCLCAQLAVHVFCAFCSPHAPRHVLPLISQLLTQPWFIIRISFSFFF